jgi:hypothetical protein
MRDVKRVLLQFNAPRLDFGQAQDIVNHPQQVLAAAIDDTQPFLLRFVYARITSQKSGKTENRVERGAQLVTHVGLAFSASSFAFCNSFVLSIT